jgi:hypothetical protein
MTTEAHGVQDLPKAQPCPFCGSAEIGIGVGNFSDVCAVCMQCKAGGPCVAHKDRPYEDQCIMAIGYWNLRVPPQ